MMRTQGREAISTKLERIAHLAREHPGWAFTNLAHHIDIELLKEAYRRTRKDGAVGIDGQTAAAYAPHLEAHLASLLERFRAGTYRAPPVKRAYVPKANGERRPIGIPTFEDKVLQRAVAMVLEAIYEQDFLDCSYGFRPGRSAHQALEATWKGLMDLGGGWIVELDIEQYFDTIDVRLLRGILDQRVNDGVMRRVIHKWLKAGVMEEGVLRRPKAGTPQGGVISPLLANVYLHEVLDTWFAREVKPRLRGRSFLVRYADDAVLVFEHREDAERVLAVLPKRFAKYGLRLHPEKTRLVCFRRPARQGPNGHGPNDPPTSFDLLGFTHVWGTSRKGRWVVKQKTARSRLTRALERIRLWCRIHRHQPVAEQHEALCRKLRGHYGYYGITGNIPALSRFWGEVRKIWHKWLNRRSGRKHMLWPRYEQLLVRYPLPRPRIVQSALARSAKP